MPFTQLCDIRIGLTQATLYPLAWYGLPIPSITPRPYSIQKVCGDMSAKGYGFESQVWSWRQLSQAQMLPLFNLYDDPLDASKALYMRSYRDYDAISPVDYYGIMYRPVDGSGASIMPQTAFHWANIQLRWGHLVEV